MRILKDDTHKAILQAARKEFVDKGFKEASMRNIAKDAGVGLSNIYNYFRNKDEIFLAIVNPAKDKLFTFIAELHTEPLDFTTLTPLGHDEESIEYYMKLIFEYKEEYRLLLYRSQGSSMENFRDLLTDHITGVSNGFMTLERHYYPNAQKVSAFFVNIISLWMIGILGEMVTHNMDRQKIRDFFYEYFRFNFAGWRELTGL